MTRGYTALCRRLQAWKTELVVLVPPPTPWGLAHAARGTGPSRLHARPPTPSTACHLTLPRREQDASPGDLIQKPRGLDHRSWDARPLRNQGNGAPNACAGSGCASAIPNPLWPALSPFTQPTAISCRTPSQSPYSTKNSPRGRMGR